MRTRAKCSVTSAPDLQIPTPEFLLSILSRPLFPRPSTPHTISTPHLPPDLQAPSSAAQTPAPPPGSRNAALQFPTPPPAAPAAPSPLPSMVGPEGCVATQFPSPSPHLLLAPPPPQAPEPAMAPISLQPQQGTIAQALTHTHLTAFVAHTVQPPTSIHLMFPYLIVLSSFLPPLSCMQASASRPPPLIAAWAWACPRPAPSPAAGEGPPPPRSPPRCPPRKHRPSPPLPLPPRPPLGFLLPPPRGARSWGSGTPLKTRWCVVDLLLGRSAS